MGKTKEPPPSVQPLCPWSFCVYVPRVSSRVQRGILEAKYPTYAPSSSHANQKEGGGSKKHIIIVIKKVVRGRQEEHVPAFMGGKQKPRVKRSVH